MQRLLPAFWAKIKQSIPKSIRYKNTNKDAEEGDWMQSFEKALNLVILEDIETVELLLILTS